MVVDGKLRSAIAEDRLDRIKHSNSPNLPKRAIETVRSETAINNNQIDCVGISYTNITIERILPRLKEEIRDLIGNPTLPIYGIGHHDCHAWSTYCNLPNIPACLMVADGAGDIIDDKIEAESYYICESTGPRLLHRRLQDFGQTRTDRRNTFEPDYLSTVDREKQISLGRKYEQLTYLIGFKHGEAGKTMGLASYASPLFEINPPTFTSLNFDLKFCDYLDEIQTLAKTSNQPWHRFKEQTRSSIAALAQAIIEKYTMRSLSLLKKDTGLPTLAAAGGLFLNCVLNHKILELGMFERVAVFPAAGDDGQAVGAALAAYHLNEPGSVSTTGHRIPYTGPTYSSDEIINAIQYFAISAKRLEDSWLASEIARNIAKGKIVALFRGRSELGPRALGHRSIFADPRQSGMTDCLNLVKGRESYRPFAPIVKAEDQFKYFTLLQDSPFMLFAAKVEEPFREKLPAITHVDNTARVQAVNQETQPFLYSILDEFEKLTGYSVLLNTSFNHAGDPIVETPHDALAEFLSSNIDHLVLQNFYISSKARRSRSL